MKGNNGLGNTIERDEWETNIELFNKLNNQYDFEFDCCACALNNKCGRYSETFEEVSNMGLLSWMNPPFSKARKMFEHFFKVVEKGVAIYRCDNMETKVWQEVILKNATWIFIPVGRVSYYCHKYKRNGNNRNDSRFPSALIGFNVEPPKDLDGWCVIPKKRVKVINDKEEKLDED